MAQYNTGNSSFQTHNKTLFEVNMLATKDGLTVADENPLPVVAVGATSVSAFNEPLGLTITPVIQLDGVYGTTSDVIQTYNTGSGSGAGSDTQMFYANSGTTAYGYGVVRSRRILRYRPGQGALCRFTAMYSPPIDNSTQRAGLISLEQALNIGYNGTQFGVLRANGGKAHITVLTINVAPTGSQTATVTLNGVAFNISITAGTTTATAVTIASTTFSGWEAQQVDNTIVFLSTSLGVKSGTYSFSSSGAGTLATGTFSAKQAGVDQTETWTYQNQFNIDRLDGTKGTINDVGLNPSGMLLDPSKINIYQINFRWLGAGEIRYAIENSINGNMVFFHHEHYSNRNIVPHLANPSFKTGYAAASLGSTTNLTVKGSSMMGAIEGDIRQNELGRSTSVITTSLGSSAINHLVTIRNPAVTNGKSGALNGNYIVNSKELILKDISISIQGNDPAIVYIFFDATSFSGVHSYSSNPKNNALICNVTGTFNGTIDPAIFQFAVGINGTSQTALSSYRITIPPDSSISIAVYSLQAISKAACTVTWSED